MANSPREQMLESAFIFSMTATHRDFDGLGYQLRVDGDAGDIGRRSLIVSVIDCDSPGNTSVATSR